MKLVRNICLMIFAAAAFAQQGTKPKTSPEEYPAHAQDGATAIGAEYLVHSFSRGEDLYLAKGYLVVEVALFPGPGQTVDVKPEAFRLRIDDRRTLSPDSPEMVAASLAHPEWRREPNGEADVHIPGAPPGTDVVIGRPPPVLIPGMPDPNPPGPRIPQVPKDNSSGVEAHPRETPEALVLDTALAEASRKLPVSGFLYFAYPGKASSIKSIELIYNAAVLRLR